MNESQIQQIALCDELAISFDIKCVLEPYATQSSDELIESEMFATYMSDEMSRIVQYWTDRGVERDFLYTILAVQLWGNSVVQYNDAKEVRSDAIGVSHMRGEVSNRQCDEMDEIRDMLDAVSLNTRPVPWDWLADNPQTWIGVIIMGIRELEDYIEKNE